jgi:glutamate synthase (NADPH/NADH) small chain
MREQGARCMDCGVPFCHTGKLVDGLTIRVPDAQPDSGVERSHLQGTLAASAGPAAARTNNFPEFTGRVCPAPCEGSCVLGINAPPVTIKVNECAIIDRGFDEGWVVAQPPDAADGQDRGRGGLGPGGVWPAPTS